MFDVLLARWADFADSIAFELAVRDWVDWIVCFAPILVFLEIPRTYLPLVWLLLRRGFVRERSVAVRAAFVRREPLVSVVIAGRNEAPTIEAALRAVLDQSYGNFEVIVVDDASEDRMFELASRFRGDPRVRVVRNQNLTGRTGRPSATNLGLRYARGEFLVSLDADTTIDRGTLRALVAPFADPRVGVVAGNVLVRNPDVNWLTRVQTLEYVQSIELRKQWTDLCDCTLMASGAIGAFRVSAVRELRGWSQELAEDSDISVRMRKIGWKLAFARDAVALTEVPEDLGTVVRQRRRWDRGGWRAYFKKHAFAFRPRVVGWTYALEMAAEFFFAISMTALYPFYLACMLATEGPVVLGFVWLVSMAAYLTLSASSVGAIAHLSSRIERPLRLVPAALILPFYKGLLRWVRLHAITLELTRRRYEDGFLPELAWFNAPRW
ncbi:MAG: glycosyltransferase family 2 protein [Planctomycetes bacterium]|nr:glycosyltransferase family 2 protein [Planctomycetota bacterium]